MTFIEDVQLNITLWVLRRLPKKYAINMFARWFRDDLIQMLNIYAIYDGSRINRTDIFAILIADGWSYNRCLLTWYLLLLKGYIQEVKPKNL